MTKEEALNLLIPGDILLYSGKSLLSFTIRVKTWSKFSHSEVYLGNGFTATSREGIGVRTFALEVEDLKCVLRPHAFFGLDMTEAREFHKSCVGQPYDTFGLLRFFRIGKETERKAFCSEHCTRVSRKIRIFLDNDQTRWDHFKPFSKHYDADLVSPGMFYSSPNYNIIWEYQK